MPLAADPDAGRVHDQRLARVGYEMLEQHENIVAFSVDGDDLGRSRRLITMPMTWRTARIDDRTFVNLAVNEMLITPLDR